MGIPNKISPLTGGDMLPRGYLPAEFLTSNLEEYIDTGIILDQDSQVDLVFKPNSVYEDGYLLGSRVSTTQDAMCFYSETPGNTWFNWDTTVERVLSMSKSALGVLKIRGPEWHVSYDMGDGTVREASRTFDKKSFNTPSSCYLMAYNLVDGAVKKGFTGNVYSLSIANQGGSQRVFTPAISADGKPCMFDKVSRKPFYNAGTGSFIVGFTLAQARNLRKLPATGGTLTISLPWEAQWDTGVQSALSIAATRGWTITVQYRDPEIATTTMPIGFLESTGTQYIKTDIPASGDLCASGEYDITISGCIYGSRKGADTHSKWSASYTHFSLAQGITFGYNKIYNYLGSFDTNKKSFFKETSALEIDGNVIVEKEKADFEGLPIFLFSCNTNGNQYLPFTGKIYNLTFADKTRKAVFVSALDTQGVPCMYDLVTNQPFYNDGTGAFIAGFDTVAQARNLAHLPDVTAETDTAKKSLTVSLPWEAQLVITGVPAALQVAADRGWTITVQYREPEANNEYYNRYAECVTIEDMFAVNSQYETDLTVNAEWVYPLSSFKSGKCIFGWAYGDYPNGRPTPIKVFNADAPIATNISGMFMRCYDLETIKGTFLKVQRADEMCWGCEKLSVVEAEFPALVSAPSMFTKCQLNKESILRVLNSIPSYTSGTYLLTIGIHIDHQTDEEVLAAIADAEAKGWTLTVQWNGTATAAAASVSTFGLRSPSIYAKLNTIEFSDGTTEQILDWGHYVTNWEENGYQEFSSVEEANEYFNINQTEEEV